MLQPPSIRRTVNGIFSPKVRRPTPFIAGTLSSIVRCGSLCSMRSFELSSWTCIAQPWQSSFNLMATLQRVILAWASRLACSLREKLSLANAIKILLSLHLYSLGDARKSPRASVWCAPSQSRNGPACVFVSLVAASGYGAMSRLVSVSFSSLREQGEKQPFKSDFFRHVKSAAKPMRTTALWQRL